MSSSEAVPFSDATREGEGACFPTARQFFALLIGYFALQVLIRTVLSASVDLDESEQVLLTQKFSLGYGSDPPVYGWLQMVFFAVFGRGVFALALLKDLLLAATYGFVYGSARVLTRSHLCGVAAALSLLFIPHVAWESQRDLTHSVLVSAAAAATLFCLLRAHETKRVGWYLALGVCCGVGFEAKYNFAFWAVGLLAAGLSLREFRATVLSRGMLLALAVGLLIALPNLVWVVGHRELAMRTTAKLGIEGSESWLAATWNGLRHIGQGVVAFVGPPAAVYLLVLLGGGRTERKDGRGGEDMNGGRGRPAHRQAGTPALRGGAITLMVRAWAIIIGVLVLLVVCFRVTGFRERWFQPLLVCVPVLGIAVLRERFDARRLRWVTGIGLGMMGLIAVLIPGRIVLMERLHREEPLARPYGALARQMQPALAAPGLLVSDTMVLGGNLLLNLEGQRVTTPELANLLGDGAPHCALVWDATKRDLPSKALAEWARAVRGVDWSRAQPQYFSATYKFHHSKQYRVGLLRVN